MTNQSPLAVRADQADGTPASAAAGKLRVVYVAGSGHTGSTLLALLLNEHPEIVSVGETAVKPKIRRKGRAARQQCSCGQTVETCPFWSGIFQRVRAQGYEFGPDCWSNDYRSEHPLVHRVLTRESSRSVVRALQGWSARRLPVHAQRMRRADAVNVAFIRAALASEGATVFCDTTKHSFRLARLLDLPDLHVSVITLVRDVRGYCASAKRRGYRIEDAALTWRRDQEGIESITRALPADRKYLLRYEDLCGRPEETLARLYAFCGVSPVAPVTSVVPGRRHVLGNSMRLRDRIHVRLDETWRAALTPEEQRRVMRVAGATNAGFGYSNE